MRSNLSIYPPIMHLREKAYQGFSTIGRLLTGALKGKINAVTIQLARFLSAAMVNHAHLPGSTLRIFLAVNNICGKSGQLPRLV